MFEQLDLFSHVPEPVENPLPPPEALNPALEWWRAKEQYFKDLQWKLMMVSAHHLEQCRAAGNYDDYRRLAPMRRWHHQTVDNLRREATAKVRELEGENG